MGLIHNSRNIILLCLLGVVLGFQIIHFSNVSGQSEEQIIISGDNEKDPILIKIVQEEGGIDWVAVGVFVTAGSLVLTILNSIQEGIDDRRTKQEEIKLSMGKMMREFDENLVKTMREERELSDDDDKEDCIRIAGDFLNILDRLAYLRKIDSVGNLVINYYNHFFESAKVYMWWRDKITKKKDADKKWPAIYWWIRESRRNYRDEEYRILIGDYDDLGKRLREILEEIEDRTPVEMKHEFEKEAPEWYDWDNR